MADMTCPRCHAPLVELDRDGITIDRCAGCRGIWLDRGELEKFLARAPTSEASVRHRRDDDDDDHRDDRRGKRSWWEIFD